MTEQSPHQRIHAKQVHAPGRRLAAWTLGGLVSLLSACGGGGDQGGTPMGATPEAARVRAQSVSAAAATTRADAFRLLTQASFGPTEAEVQRVMAIGPSAWIDEQLAMPAQQVYLSRWDAEEAEFKLNKPGSSGPKPLWHTFYQQSLRADDQLRQRVVFALSEILVVSQLSLQGPKAQAVASYMDMLTRNAFGNYRTLLEDVSLHPAMGMYLSHVGNRKEHVASGLVPDQNFAREVMQLFSIGLVELRQNGTPRLDARGLPVETYTAADIEGLSRVFTGYSWAGPDISNSRFFNNLTIADPLRYTLPMQPHAQFHSTAEKQFLGTTVPVQTAADPNASLKAAMDTLFNHRNVGPFIARQLIQRLVTSNPNPAYVQRVAQAFNDNGAGVRGDMKAVLRAILLDTQARAPSAADNANYGKLREPVLRLTAYLRAFNAQSLSGRFLIENTEDPAFGLAQGPMRSPSVFNYFRPSYTPPGTQVAAAGLVAPEMQISSETSVAGYANFMRTAVEKGVGEYVGTDELRLDVRPDFTAELALATQPAALVDHVTQRLLGDSVDALLKTEIQSAVESIFVPVLRSDGANAYMVDRAKRYRVNAAVLLTLVSPEFIVQR